MKKDFNLTIDRNILTTHNVIVLYLFGSHAKNTAAETSDMDIGVLFKDNVSSVSTMESLTLLSLELEKIFSLPIDIISLNTVPLLLQYEVISSGKVLYCADEKTRIDFEVKIIKEYIDDKPIRELYNNALYKRILERRIDGQP